MGTYREPLVRTTAMMVRFIHAHRINNKEGLGDFALIGIPEQATAALALYNLLLDSQGSPELEDLENTMHRLFRSFLITPILSDEPIACPTDQMMLLAALLPAGHYCYAQAIHGRCARLQFCFRCVLFHESKLRGPLPHQEAMEILQGLASDALPDEVDDDEADIEDSYNDEECEGILQLDKRNDTEQNNLLSNGKRDFFFTSDPMMT